MILISVESFGQILLKSFRLSHANPSDLLGFAFWAFFVLSPRSRSPVQLSKPLSSFDDSQDHVASTGFKAIEIPHESKQILSDTSLYS